MIKLISDRLRRTTIVDNKSPVLQVEAKDGAVLANFIGSSGGTFVISNIADTTTSGSITASAVTANTQISAEEGYFSRGSGKDQIAISPRNGGTLSYALFITTATLTQSRTITFPNVTGTLITDGNLTDITSIGTLANLTVTGNVIIDTNTLFVDSTNNRVGIGTASPTTTLDVSGEALVSYITGGTTTTSNLPNLVTTFSKEKISVTGAGLAAESNISLSTASIYYYNADATANSNINLYYTHTSGTLDSKMLTGESATFAIIVQNGTTAYWPSVFKIDGNTVTPKWQGGTAPTGGNASSNDIYVYNIIKTGANAFTVFASQTKFGS